MSQIKEAMSFTSFGRPKFITALAMALLFSLSFYTSVFAGKILLGEHYSPEENLERIDFAVLGSAKKTIDVAMYAFTDRSLAYALVNAARRGVLVRVYRDKTQMRDRNDQTSYLLQNGVRVRSKNNSRFNIMHLKAYAVDGQVLRTGSANWSPAGEGASCWRGDCGHNEQQDNNLSLTENPSDVSHFEQTFNRIWHRSDNIRFDRQSQ